MFERDEKRRKPGVLPAVNKHFLNGIKYPEDKHNRLNAGIIALLNLEHLCILAKCTLTDLSVIILYRRGFEKEEKGSVCAQGEG